MDRTSLMLHQWISCIGIRVKDILVNQLNPNLSSNFNVSRRIRREDNGHSFDSPRSGFTQPGFTGVSLLPNDRVKMQQVLTEKNDHRQ